MLVGIHLVPLGTPADPAAKTRMDKLEAQESVLTLCAARWKAEHVVANCLTAIVDAQKAAKRKNAREEIESDGDGGLEVQQGKRRRTQIDEQEQGWRKNKRRDRDDRGKGVKFETCFRVIQFVHDCRQQPRPLNNPLMHH